MMDAAVKLALEVLKKHGAFALFALALLGMLWRLSNAILIDMANDLDHLARLVDVSCNVPRP